MRPNSPENVWLWAIVLVGTANVVCVILYAWDKRAAIRGRRRVPERRLLLASLPLTAAGAWAAVLLLRHKSSKASYLAKLSAVTVIQVACVAWWLWSGR